jgi:hypothetical protein
MRSAPEILRPEVGDLGYNGHFAISRHASLRGGFLF